MIKVIIQRSKWSRGLGSDYNALLVSEYNVYLDSKLKVGTMCCLGFACLALGCTMGEINEVQMPDGIGKIIPGLTFQDESCYPYPKLTNTDFSIKASEINDNDSLTDEGRERQLKELALQHGFEFEFVD